MRFFAAPTTSSNTVDAGTAVILKPSRWKKLFRRRRRGSLSSTSSETFSRDLSASPSLDEIRVVGHVQEITLRAESPESTTSIDADTVFSRKDSVDTLTPTMTRNLFSEGTIFVDALEDNTEIQRLDTMKSVYVDALPGEDTIEVTEKMEITVVAEVRDGSAAI
jgi:hypothetical protein